MSKRLVLLSGVFCVGVALAQEAPRIKIQVQEEREREAPEIPVERKKAKPKTETTVKEREIQRGASAGGVNVYRAIELTPSLNVQTDDAYGIGGGSVRLRGFDDRQIGISIDDMPLNDSGNKGVRLAKGAPSTQKWMEP